MAVSLLRATNLVSLEYAQEDHEAVKTALFELFGKAEITRRLASSKIRIGGEDFVFQNEWDDPCLISGTERGAEMLQAVADKLNGL